MDYQTVIAGLGPDIVARLRKGIETGRWPDGSTLTPEQREHSLQAVIAWEQNNLPQERRVGFIDKGSKSAASMAEDAPTSTTLRWVGNPEEGDE